MERAHKIRSADHGGCQLQPRRDDHAVLQKPHPRDPRRAKREHFAQPAADRLHVFPRVQAGQTHGAVEPAPIPVHHTQRALRRGESVLRGIEGAADRAAGQEHVGARVEPAPAFAKPIRRRGRVESRYPPRPIERRSRPANPDRRSKYPRVGPQHSRQHAQPPREGARV